MAVKTIRCVASEVEHPELYEFAKMLEQDGYQVCVNRVRGNIEESDWVILRLLLERILDHEPYTNEGEKAMKYILDKYDSHDIGDAIILLRREKRGERV